MKNLLVMILVFGVVGFATATQDRIPDLSKFDADELRAIATQAYRRVHMLEAELAQVRAERDEALQRVAELNETLRAERAAARNKKEPGQGEPTFQVARWGMSRDEVRDREDRPPATESPEMLRFVNKAVAGHIRTDVIYTFIDDKCVMGAVLFDKSPHFSRADLQRLLTQKHGQPLEVVNGVASWETPDTHILLAPRSLLYTSKAHRHLIEERRRARDHENAKGL